MKQANLRQRFTTKTFTIVNDNQTANFSTMFPFVYQDITIRRRKEKSFGRVICVFQANDVVAKIFENDFLFLVSKQNYNNEYFNIGLTNGIFLGKILRFRFFVSKLHSRISNCNEKVNELIFRYLNIFLIIW